MVNFSEINGMMLSAITDAIDERIYSYMGDVVHTDWKEEDWTEYKNNNLYFRDETTYLEFAEAAEKCSDIFEISPPEKLAEFAEITGFFMSIFLKRLKG